MPGSGTGWAHPVEASATCAAPPNYLKHSNGTPIDLASDGQSEWGGFHGFKSKHPGGVQFVDADGSVHFVKDTIPLSTYRGLASFAGGERLIDAPGATAPSATRRTATATARIRVGVLLAVALAVNAAGCKDEGERLAPVGGVLTVQAKPVPNGAVTFYSDAAKGNATQHQPCGGVAADGRFELFVPGGRKGAPPGWYKVVVYAVDDPRPGKPNRYWVAKKYADRDTTPLAVEVIEAPEPGRYDRQLDK